jgi:hypothetical protein
MHIVMSWASGSGLSMQPSNFFGPRERARERESERARERERERARERERGREEGREGEREGGREGGGERERGREEMFTYVFIQLSMRTPSNRMRSSMQNREPRPPLSPRTYQSSMTLPKER